MDDKYVKAAGLGLALIILLQIPGLYGSFLPNPCDVSRERPDSEYSGRIRKSETYATVIALGFGFAGSLITDSPWPFFAVAILCAAIVFHYETSLRFTFSLDNNDR